MNIREELEKIWKSDYISELPYFVKERGFVYSENYVQKDILITGINPSFRNDAEFGNYGFDFQNTLKETKYDNYWSPLKKIIFNEIESVDLREISSYSDIFYFREKNQNRLKKEILKSKGGIRFIVKQLEITQKIIEEIIKPKLIIVKNKESAAYWGKLSEFGIIWMGYEFEFIKDFTCGELYKIKGLSNSKERISFGIQDTNLKDSLVLFTHHISQYTKKEKRPEAKLISDLLEML